jgi:hypothetical protein
MRRALRASRNADAGCVPGGAAASESLKVVADVRVPADERKQYVEVFGRRDARRLVAQAVHHSVELAQRVVGLKIRDVHALGPRE